MTKSIHEVFPVGVKVEYLGGCEVGDQILVIGKVYDITEKDTELGTDVSGFKYDEGDHDFFPISFGGFLFPNNATNFKIVE